MPHATAGGSDESGPGAARPEAARDGATFRPIVQPRAAAGDPLLAALAHDLRSPLQGAQGWLGVLEQSLAVDPSITERAIEGIRRGLRQQARLIARLEAAGALLGRASDDGVAPVTLSGLVRRACEQAGPRAAAAGAIAHGLSPASDCALASPGDTLVEIVDLVADAVLADVARPEALWLKAGYGLDGRPALVVATGRTPPAGPESAQADAAGGRRCLPWLLAERLAAQAGARVLALRARPDGGLGVLVLLARTASGPGTDATNGDHVSTDGGSPSSNGT